MEKEKCPMDKGKGEKSLMDKEKVEEYSAGIKWTKQRKRVYQILKEAIEPLSAAQIYARMEAWEQEQYAISTIYRILSAFEENQMVDKTTWMGEGTVVYELKRPDHVHYAVCLECHRRIPLEHCPLHMSAVHFHAGVQSAFDNHEKSSDHLEGHDPQKCASRDRDAAKEMETEGFTVVSHKIELYGYCKECKEKHQFP